MTFFGLSSDDRTAVFNEIHEIVFFGNGGYSWQDVYKMPVWLRKYTYNTLIDWYKKQNQEETLEEATEQKRKIFQPNIPTPPDLVYKVPTPKK